MKKDKKYIITNTLVKIMRFAFAFVVFFIASNYLNISRHMASGLTLFSWIVLSILLKPKYNTSWQELGAKKILILVVITSLFENQMQKYSADNGLYYLLSIMGAIFLVEIASIFDDIYKYIKQNK
ncbi:MAG: hypothetical protein ACLUOG_02450 [Peptoniphilus lacrimalis]